LREPRHVPSKEFREQRDKKIWKLFHEERKKKSAIAERFGMSEWAVGRALERMEREEKAEKIVEFIRKDYG